MLFRSARAAGATGAVAGFDRYWTEAWQLIGEGVAERLRAAAALELGLGALDLSRWSDAEHALAVAIEGATASGENETLVKASAALERLGRREVLRVPQSGSGTRQRVEDTFANELAAVLVAHGSETHSTPEHDSAEA